ncbi:hypothetical protein ANRL1_02570 [Anaerolineae bacterium]|nr:hypothetical protein ANRL1_02570 [Anaerolineae bacterium]
MSAPKLESAGFGWLIANGTRYDYDLIITVDGEIVPRPKHLSKKYGGWHTVLGPEEMPSALVGNPKILVVARGHFGVLPIRTETRALLAQRGVQLELARVRDAMKRYDELTRQGKRVAAILHLTC